MKIQQEVLIDHLKKDVEVLLKCVGCFRDEIDALLIQPVPGKWSITQILEHLNGFGRYYLPAMDKAIASSPSTRKAWFNSGGVGNYFTKMMAPADPFEVKNKMKTLKKYSPDSNLKPEKVMDEFIQQQHTLLRLLEISRNKSLNDIYVPISLTKMIKFNLGDTFRFFIAHEQRHFVQARNALHYIGCSTSNFPVILQQAASV